MVRRVLACACLLFLGSVPEVLAQSDPSAWGFSGSFVPKWKTPRELAILFGADSVDVSGSELRLGIVRGRITGGDWGVSFVRKSFKEGSGLAGDRDSQCINNSCVEEYSTAQFQNVQITGIEAHRFIPFATIKRRAQIGLTVAGGIGSWKGTARIDNFFGDFAGAGLVQRHEREDVPVEELFVLNRSIVPLFRLEVSGAAILTDHFKVRVGGGVNFPGTQTLAIQGIFLLPR